MHTDRDNMVATVLKRMSLGCSLSAIPDYTPVCKAGNADKLQPGLMCVSVMVTMISQCMHKHALAPAVVLP